MTTFPKHIHCVGIGGIGLSALAQLLLHEGHVVTGSDRSESPVTHLLSTLGISVAIGHSKEAVPENTELLIYSAAVPEEAPERISAREMGIPSLSYFEALGAVSEGKKTIAVSGTHGKTTTTAMITKMLVDLGKSPTAIIGSLTKDFESNFVAPSNSSGQAGVSDIFVVEACEYRRHFLHISPLILVITNMEWDHTDFFPTIEDVVSAFHEMTKKVRDGGTIVTSGSVTMSLSSLKNGPAQVVFYDEETVPSLNMIGAFNEMNARAAKAAVKVLVPDADESVLNASLQSFKGTWRRFEYKGKTKEGADVFDDYAHHPTAIAETLKGVRAKFSGKRVVVAFHPHLYSRTKALLADFAKALAGADQVLVAPIFAAREKPDPEISNGILADAINAAGGKATAADSFEDIEKTLRACADGDLIITMGAGDIYKVADALTAR